MAHLPLTQVRLLTGVPLDNTYTDTLTFGSLTSQVNYFMNKQKVVADGLTYQREEMYIRYPAPYDNIIDCNYLMYQNVAYGSKWFYAFITKIEYINDNTSWIYFEIDAYQTYMFDVQIKSCFVEREHTNNDSIGANLLDEGLALGDYVTINTTSKYFRSWWICIGATIDLRVIGENVGGNSYGGVFSGITYYTFDSTYIDFVNDTLKRLAVAGKSDAIVNMFMLPKDIANSNQINNTELIDSPRIRTSLTLPNSRTLNGYTPVNKKLLTYPYRGCTLSNLSGSAVTLRYEFFTGSTPPSVGYQGGIQQNSRIICAPENYKGLAINFDEGVSLGNFPQCIWSKDVYANWLASQSIRNGYTSQRLLVNSVANIGQGALMTALTGNPLNVGQAALNTVGSIYDTYSKMAEEKEVYELTPPAARGSLGNDYTNLSLSVYGFLCSERTITAEVARCIDNYFSMYGYKTNRVKVPNINGRTSWNYVKVQNAKVIGKCPTPAIDTIKKMLTNGVTFWHGDWVGDYSRANGIV